LLKEEGECLEFKGSLRYNINIKAVKNGVESADPRLEKTALATICAFLNSEGGTLIIGIENNTKKVLGLKNDYNTFSDEKKRNRDGFENHLRNMIVDNITPYVPRLVKIDFESVGDEEVCLVQVQKSSEAMFLKDKVGNRDIQELWVRDGNGKRQLEGVDMAEYLKRNWSPAV
jgi:predicted HTH transcriptional regulator